MTSHLTSYPEYQIVILPDGREIRFGFGNLEALGSVLESPDWKKDTILFGKLKVEIFRNDLGSVFAVTPAHKIFYAFDSEEDYQKFQEKVRPIVINHLVYSQVMISKADFELLSKRNELMPLAEMSTKLDKYFLQRDGRVVYVDDYWKEGMMYRNIEEYAVIEKNLGGIPMLIVPSISPSETVQPDSKD